MIENITGGFVLL